MDVRDADCGSRVIDDMIEEGIRDNRSRPHENLATEREGFSSALFIVGAPRCGTTILSKLMSRHPHVCFSKPKETHFFLREPAPSEPAEDRRQFLTRHFGALGPQHLMIAEGSVSYLYVPKAIERLLRAFPAAKLVVGLRNPVDLIHSFHDRMVYMTEEDQPDLARAWDLQGERAQGRCVPRGCRDWRLLQYRDIGRIATHLEGLFRAAGRERVFTYLHEDFVRNPAEIYTQVLHFSGLPHDGRRYFEASAAGPRRYRSRWLQELSVGKLGPATAALINIYQRNAGWPRRVLRPVKRKLKQWNTQRTATKPPLPPELRDRLVREFAPEVDRLEQLLGRELSHWRSRG
jgi:hypothetical protein